MTTTPENAKNNPMGTGLTKPDVSAAVERLEAWFSNLEDIYPDDVRAALEEIKRYDDGGFCGRIAHCALKGSA